MVLDPVSQALIISGGGVLVSAIATDAWAAARAGFARLFGRGDQDRQASAEQRLDRSATQLDGLSGDELEQARQAQAQAWQTRLADLVEEHPELAGELASLVREIERQLPAGGHRVHITDAGAVSVGGNVELRGTFVAGRDLDLSGTATVGSEGSPAEPPPERR
ncbi:hypothetical protein [Phytohabitans rumicis]|uniref:Uncharacterized protein n=1 Tax=Phytohabitans rumicis TaxID=1076125 RepID=A0A6V8LN08_9ACTN|nr:hypothetical protein [Phytohabitans rumicis]GFJ95556.1 hypothetical protein Prum_091980 [Phytohabitans rumicis]